MSNISPLEEYAVYRRQLAEFAQTHAEILRMHVIVKAELEQAEAALKEWARTNGPTENADYTVSVQTKTRRWYDATPLVAIYPWLLNNKATTISVDTKSIDRMVKAGAIDDRAAAETERTEPMTSAVTIKPKPKVEVTVDKTELPF
jgi:hypothetical protein